MRDFGINRPSELTAMAGRHPVEAAGGTKHPKAVVMLTCQYTEILGGAEKQCRSLAEELRRRNFNVVVVTSRVPHFPPDEEPAAVRFWTPYPPQLAGKFLFASLIWAVQVFAWIVWNRKSIAVLHCHQLRVNAYVAALAHALLGLPTVMKLGVGGGRNDFTVIGSRKYLIGPGGARFVIAHADAVVATASQIAEDSRDWGVPASRIVCIPNGVDLSRYAAAVGEPDERLPAFDRVARMAVVGRISAEKNVQALLDALVMLEVERPVELHFLGSGPLESELKQKAAALQQSFVRIVFHGQLPDILPLLSRMHFLVSCSRSEGLSNALLEAAAAGVVPVLSDASGNRDVVTFSDYPLFLQGFDAPAIAAALASACAFSPAEWTRWSVRIARHTRANFDLDDVALQYASLYRTLMESSSRKRAPCPHSEMET